MVTWRELAGAIQKTLAPLTPGSPGYHILARLKSNIDELAVASEVEADGFVTVHQTAPVGISPPATEAGQSTAQTKPSTSTPKGKKSAVDIAAALAD